MSFLPTAFPELDPGQLAKLDHYAALLAEWNQRLNLVSRQETAHLVERHLAPALAFSRLRAFAPKTSVLDIGTGGGLPGLPLAIRFPESRFLLIDSIGKKITAVQAMVRELGLTNVEARQTRVEAIRLPFDFITGRAVTALPQFLAWATPLLRGQDGGVLYQKGTLWRDELAPLGLEPADVLSLASLLPGDYFQDKFILAFNTPYLRRHFPQPQG